VAAWLFEHSTRDTEFNRSNLKTIGGKKWTKAAQQSITKFMTDSFSGYNDIKLIFSPFVCAKSGKVVFTLAKFSVITPAMLRLISLPWPP
jgi:hypothetical protein